MLSTHRISKGLQIAAIICALVAPLASGAVSIIGGPTFTPANRAPLAGTLELTTDVESRVIVLVDDGTGAPTWERRFFPYSTRHSIPLLGFKPGRRHTIFIKVLDRRGQSASAGEPLVFATDPLPPDFPRIAVLKSQPERMEPGYTLFRVAMANNTRSYLVVINHAGEVVWYSGIVTSLDVRQLPNGNLFLPQAVNFFEVNLLGETLRTWNVPGGLGINFHDGVPTDHNSILYLNDASLTLTNFPSSTTNANAPLRTTNVLVNRVVEMSTINGELLNLWSPVEILDPRRLTYLTLVGGGALGVDIQHANALIEDPSDDSIIVSIRHQNAVVKFSRADGQLKWILGPHENWGPEFQRYLLKPVGTPFAWQYAQHAPVITPQGTLLVYDNGNFRATPFDPPVPDARNFSRAVEYKIDEAKMEVTQVWSYGDNVSETLYTDKVGSADWLPKTGNVLIDFGSVTYVGGKAPSQLGTKATMTRFKEVTHDSTPEVVFDVALTEFDNPNVSFGDCFVYRCHRIPDLYGHEARAVTDLAVSFTPAGPRLRFSADETREYVIEASDDLAEWERIGLATQKDQTGEFQYVDDEAPGVPIRYYRVVTQ